MEHVPPKEVWKLQPPRTQVEPHDPSREHPDDEWVQKSLPSRSTTRGASGDHTTLGPIMKVKNFRLNVVFESSVTALFVYVPDGVPPERLTSRGLE